MGKVTEVVKRYVPASYRAMIGPSEYTDYYSLSDLQAIADLVKFKLLATVVNVTEEGSFYDPLLIDFLGKVTTLKFLPAAIDYWGDQLLQVQTSGTNESENFPDRQPSLLKLAEELGREIRREFLELAPVYGFVIRGSARGIPGVSYGDNGRNVLRTPDPQRWPKQQRTQRGTELWPWGEF